MENVVMKKIVLMTILLFCTFSFNYSLGAKNIDLDTIEDYKTPNLDDNIEILYQDIFLTLLDSIINTSLEKQYNGNVIYDIWDIKVLSVERINPGRTIGFILKIEVIPYQGAHNIIGIDNMTIEIQSGHNPKVLKFEHIKSYN